MTDVSSIVLDFIDKLNPSVKATKDSTLADDLQFDALDCVELAMDVEKEFDIDVPDEILSGWKTVGDVIATVEARV